MRISIQRPRQRAPAPNLTTRGWFGILGEGGALDASMESQADCTMGSGIKIWCTHFQWHCRPSCAEQIILRCGRGAAILPGAPLRVRRDGRTTNAAASRRSGLLAPSTSLTLHYSAHFTSAYFIFDYLYVCIYVCMHVYAVCRDSFSTEVQGAVAC